MPTQYVFVDLSGLMNLGFSHKEAEKAVKAGKPINLNGKTYIIKESCRKGK